MCCQAPSEEDGDGLPLFVVADAVGWEAAPGCEPEPLEWVVTITMPITMSRNAPRPAPTSRSWVWLLRREAFLAFAAAARVRPAARATPLSRLVSGPAR